MESGRMVILQGVGASKGIEIGKMFYYSGGPVAAPKCSITDINAELARFYKAQKQIIAYLNDLYEKAVSEVGEGTAQLFQIHAMMLGDRDFVDLVEDNIKRGSLNAEYAVEQAAIDLSNMLANTDDAYMQERSADVIDVSQRVIRQLLNIDEPSLLDISGRVVVAAENLLPSQTMQLDRSKVLALVTQKGSSVSHTAILARTMGIPAITGLGIPLKDYQGCMAIVDGTEGKLYISPGQDVVDVFKEKKKVFKTETDALCGLKSARSVTKDGIPIEICANVADLGDTASAVENGCDGIGLFRSEFIYMESRTYPTEEEQFKIYRAAVEAMPGKRVIIRTLDMGADKQAPYFCLEKEENPAMGYRAIRICLDQKDLFATQLRALLRASRYGRLAVMFPMITRLDEVLKAKEILYEQKKALAQQGILTAEHIEIGIMIETPAAAMISDMLAQEVDFFSVGTNDLTQYTLAVDRMNDKISGLYDSGHLGVLRLIRLAAKNAHLYGKWIGICGETAANLNLLPIFLAMGIDELSVVPSAILELKNAVRSADVSIIKNQYAGQLGSLDFPQFNP
jgi:phosphotransferase system enzyme I (PtsI)